MNRWKAALRDETGASMLLALIFLLVSLSLGGAVLSAAGANSARAAQMQRDQQQTLADRSAMVALSELVADMPQLTIRDVSGPNGRTVICAVPEGQYSNLQLQLLAYAAARYAGEGNVPFRDMKFEHFRPERGWESMEEQGTLEISLECEDRELSHQATYTLSGSGDLAIILASLRLELACTRATGAPVSVTLEGETATTRTTVIRWDAPVLTKGGGQ